MSIAFGTRFLLSSRSGTLKVPISMYFGIEKVGGQVMDFARFAAGERRMSPSILHFLFIHSDGAIRTILFA